MPFNFPELHNNFCTLINTYLRGNTYCFSALAVFSFSESRESRPTTLQSSDPDLTRRTLCPAMWVWSVDTSAAWEGVWPRGAWIMFQRDEILNIPPGIALVSPAQPSPASIFCGEDYVCNRYILCIMYMTPDPSQFVSGVSRRA